MTKGNATVWAPYNTPKLGTELMAELIDMPAGINVAQNRGFVAGARLPMGGANVGHTRREVEGHQLGDERPGLAPWRPPAPGGTPPPGPTSLPLRR